MQPDTYDTDVQRHEFARQSKAMKMSGTRALASDRMGWVTDDSLFWRHPSARIFVLLLILTLDMYMYGEDPLNDSHVVYNVPGMNHAFGLIAFWAAPSFGLALLRLFFLVLAVLLGGYVGRRWIAGRLLRDYCKLSAFDGCEGSIFVSAIAIFAFCAVFAFLYNAMVTTGEIGATSIDLFYIFGARTKQYRHVNQVWQTLSVTVDMLSIVMITDAIIQDRHRYPNWAPTLKRFWREAYGGWVRVIGCWVVLLGGSVGLGAAIFSTGKQGSSVRGVTFAGGTTEVARALVSALMVFTDLLACVQDWDFPCFREPLELEAPTMIMGTFASELRITWVQRLVERLPRVPGLPDWLQRQLPGPGFFHITIRGKWLQYGPLVGVMLIDMLYSKTQVLYAPSTYGQYAEPNAEPGWGRVWAVVDESYIALAYSDGLLVNASMMTYEARRNASTREPLSASAATDYELNSRYIGSSTKWLGPLLGFTIIVLFCCLLRVADWRRAYDIEELERKRAGEQEPEDEVAITIDPSDPRILLHNNAPRLRIEILSASGLRDADWMPGAKSDPYVSCTILGKPQLGCQTGVISNCLDPVWDFVIDIPGYSLGDTLEFRVMDKDDWPKQDDLLGEATVTSEMLLEHGFDGELELSNSGNSSAKLRLRVHPFKARA